MRLRRTRAAPVGPAPVHPSRPLSAEDIERAAGGHVRGVFRAGAWNLAAQIGGRACVAAALALSARLLTLGSFGVLMELQAAAVLIPSIWDLGVSSWLLRDVAAGMVDPGDALRSATRARVLTAFLPMASWLVVLILLPAARARPDVVVLFFVASLFTASTALLNALMQSQLRFGLTTVCSLAGRTITVAFLAVLLTARIHDLFAVAAAYALGELLTFAAFVTASNASQLIAQTTIPVRAVLRRSRPYAINGIVNIAYNRADILTVGVFGGTLAAAEYAPASRIQDALSIIPTVAGMSLVPLAARRLRFPGAARALQRATTLGAVGTVALTVPLVLLFFLFAESLVPLALGHDYAGAIVPVRIIIWSAVFVALATAYFSILTAAGAVRVLNRVYLVIGVVSIVGQAALSYAFGAVGGAVASAGREPLALLLGFLAARSVIRQLAANPKGS